MTDGIIQEVFKRYWAHKKECNDCKYALIEVMPELIEKIKQEFGSYEGFVMSSELITKTLIGDNQE